MAEKERRTFRVRQIPHFFTEQRLAKLLKDLLAYDGTTDQIRIRSLASNVDSSERPQTKVATVCFARRVVVLPVTEDQWVFNKEACNLEHDVILDSHFLGFTVLNDVKEDEHKADCFAISGLASHPFGSWKARNDRVDFMWLRDDLPKRCSTLRCIIYGYDTRLPDSRSFQDIEDIAKALTRRLRSIGCSSPSAKPTVFLAHSLGGIILKESLVQMARSNEWEVFLLRNVIKIIFFGVPNRGMQISHLIPMAKSQPNEPFIHRLSIHSEYLSQLDEQFSGISCYLSPRLVSIYKTLQSQTPQQRTDGSWDRSGPWERLVDRESAIHRRSRESDTYPINNDHSNMVKFSEHDPDLKVVLDILSEDEVPSLSEPNQQRTLPPTSETTPKIPDSGDDTLYVPNQTGTEIDRANWRKLSSYLKESLFVEQTFERYESVEKAHQDTFAWVFDRDITSLPSWLEDNSSLFWINGKPGSGKSTAMKYICTSRQQPKHRQDSSDIEARFFFSHRGSYMQKSFEGLLRCILYQILQQSESLTNLLLNFEVELLKKDSYHNNSATAPPSHKDPWERYSLLFQAQICERWTTTSLENALFFILQQTSEDIRLLLFLDALDEFEGEPIRIAMFLLTCVQKAKTSSTRLKICFASRPWNAFNDQFVNVPYFRMEDHTHADIERYVEAIFRDHKLASGKLESSIPQTRKSFRTLQAAILSRAQGVFLWVRLVLDILLDRMADGESVEELKKSLATIPDQLEDLYVALIGRVAPKYRREAYVMLEIVLRSAKLMHPLELWNVVQYAMRNPRVLDPHDTTELEMTPEMDTILRRIRSRCGGLIEVVRLTSPTSEETTNDDIQGTSSDPRLCRIQLMHQTVREFLLLPEARRHFLRSDDSLYTLNGHWFLSQYALRMISCGKLNFDKRTVNRDKVGRRWIQKHQHCLFHAKQAEMSTGYSLLALLSQVKPVELSNWCFGALLELTDIPIITRPDEHRSGEHDNLLQSHPQLLFAILARLRITLQEILDTTRVNPRVLGYFISVLIDRPTRHLHELDISILEILLAAGADITVQSGGFNMFQSILFIVIRDWRYEWSSHYETNPEVGLEALRLVLLQDPREHSDADIFDKYRSKLGIRHSVKPLHLASEALYSSVIELLLCSGAEVNALSTRGVTPLDMVNKNADLSHECAHLLRAHGGKLSKELARKSLSTRMKILLKRMS